MFHVKHIFASFKIFTAFKNLIQLFKNTSEHTPYIFISTHLLWEPLLIIKE